MQAMAERPYGRTARLLSQRALSLGTQDAAHPLLQFRARQQRALSLLGLLRDSPDMLVISDITLDHAGGVTRAALGLRPLVRSVTSSLTIAVPPSLIERGLTSDQQTRLAALQGAHEHHQVEKSPTLSELVERGLLELEANVLTKKLRIQQLREQRSRAPQKRIFVNMSFGTSPERVALGIARALLRDPSENGHPAHVECEGPERFDDEPMDEPLDKAAMAEEEKRMKARLEARKRKLQAFKKQHVYPALRKAMARPEFVARMKTALASLEAEAKAARKAQILVFVSAGNEHASAAETGAPSMSTTATAPVPSLLRVAALDLGDFEKPDDDQVAAFSGAGRVSFGAQGVRVPVEWFDGVFEETEGTSVSSPINAHDALVIGAVDPALTVDQIADLLQDPRIARDIPNTQRDGHGAIDVFAAAIVAANPKVTREAIERAWPALLAPEPDVAAIKASLGL